MWFGKLSPIAKESVIDHQIDVASETLKPASGQWTNRPNSTVLVRIYQDSPRSHRCTHCCGKVDAIFLAERAAKFLQSTSQLSQKNSLWDSSRNSTGWLKPILDYNDYNNPHRTCWYSHNFTWNLGHCSTGCQRQMRPQWPARSEAFQPAAASECQKCLLQQNMALVMKRIKAPETQSSQHISTYLNISQQTSTYLNISQQSQRYSCAADPQPLTPHLDIETELYGLMSNFQSLLDCRIGRVWMAGPGLNSKTTL